MLMRASHKTANPKAQQRLTVTCQRTSPAHRRPPAPNSPTQGPMTAATPNRLSQGACSNYPLKLTLRRHQWQPPCLLMTRSMKTAVSQIDLFWNWLMRTRSASTSIRWGFTNQSGCCRLTWHLLMLGRVGSTLLSDASIMVYWRFVFAVPSTTHVTQPCDVAPIRLAVHLVSYFHS